jgi:hypothetical protein
LERLLENAADETEARADHDRDHGPRQSREQEAHVLKCLRLGPRQEFQAAEKPDPASEFDMQEKGQDQCRANQCKAHSGAPEPQRSPRPDGDCGIGSN